MPKVLKVLGTIMRILVVGTQSLLLDHVDKAQHTWQAATYNCTHILTQIQMINNTSKNVHNRWHLCMQVALYFLALRSKLHADIAMAWDLNACTF